ncbi:hypothetical protein [Burkholderia gladioli]|uniref:hypothetical protein n=1 Tax=Burkholderia gladioli TaxID=28095 RepID=UPI00163DFB9A|nr:hypothetical protein [Burkholderia gladioli]
MMDDGLRCNTQRSHTGLSLEDFVRLTAGGIAGVAEPKGDFALGVEALARSIREHGAELETLWGNRDSNPDFVRLAPTCARLLLEQCLATVLGRLDPIRLVAIVRGSRSPDFKIGSRNNSSFSWAEDVLPNFKPGSNPLWSQQHLKVPCRGILDGHLGDYLFGTPHDAVLDEVQAVIAGVGTLPEWLISLPKHEDGTRCLTTVRGKAEACYSILSKGMHFEFFKNHATKPTKDEIVRGIRDAILVASTCALYSHFADISLLQIDKREAATIFVNLTTKFECQ